MRPVFKILLILVVVIVVAALVVVGRSLYWFATKQSDLVVATDVNISTDWLEITPQPPLKATKQIQEVIIFVEGGKRSRDNGPLTLPDGTEVDAEVEIVDESGRAYRLHSSSIFSSGAGYTGHYGPRSSLPQDKSFTKIRIRSDKPFRASKIFWENLNLL